MTFDFNAAAGGGDAYLDQLGFDERTRFPFTTTAAPSSVNIPSTPNNTMVSSRQTPTWPANGLSMLPDMAGAMQPGAAGTLQSSPCSHSDDQQAQSPQSSCSQSPHQQHSPFQSTAHPHTHTSTLLTDWTLQQHQQQTAQDLSPFLQEAALISFNPFHANFQPSPLDFLPTTQAALEASYQMEPMFNTMSPVDDTAQAMQLGMGMANWQDFEATLQQFPEGLPRLGSLGSNSPTGTYLEVLSLPSSSGDNGWSTVDMYPTYNDYQQAQAQAQNGAIFNPGQTLHLRTNSDSSHSEGGANSFEAGSFEEVTFPYSSPFSPESDSYGEHATHRNCFTAEHHQHSHDTVSPTAAAAPMAITTTTTTATKASSSRPSPTSGSGMAGSGSTSPPPRRNSGPRKSPIAKATKPVIRRTSTGKKDGSIEKKVGRRRGPLLPEQRKQASEIRKLRACLRCKFLKKTCDKGEPCAGCQPSHARLWQVPCTRIDIKDIGYFMKDWKADYERHLGRGVSVYNVKGFAQKETLMWITHGYGFCLPIMTREVYVADESCFQTEWVESRIQDEDPIDFNIRTEKLDVGSEGISMEALAEYLDKHIDQGFNTFVDDHFEGTPFVTEVLKTAHKYYMKEKLPVIRKALKLVLAYNLTLHITLVESQGSENPLDGQVDDEDSIYYGRTVAPVMINFQIKCALADMWRELQKEVLEELSALYSSVYSGDRLKNWPTIFMLASILLVVWEEMQFDCHYRVPDPVAVNKFCSDMETTPVGVIVGLFHAISQKLPSFTEWDSKRHGQLLNNNGAVCEAMTEMRQHVSKHDTYLRSRQQNAKFDRYDFDSLSNKFLSKLVIRAN